MRPLFPKLHFPDTSAAQAALQDRFPNWDPTIQMPHTNVETFDCLVRVRQIVKLDENGEPTPSTWTGVHIDLSLQTEAPELEQYWVDPEPVDPDHSFGENLS